MCKYDNIQGIIMFTDDMWENQKNQLECDMILSGGLLLKIMGQNLIFLQKLHRIEFFMLNGHLSHILLNTMLMDE